MPTKLRSKTFDLGGRIVLVTGASSGIEAVAKLAHDLSPSKTSNAVDREIIRHIRQGTFDDPHLCQRLRRALVETSAIALRISNPELLKVNSAARTAASEGRNK